MRKADYLTLARALRERVEKDPTHTAALNRTHEEYEALRSESLQAASLARYLADHLSVDRVEFLKACGIRP